MFGATLHGFLHSLSPFTTNLGALLKKLERLVIFEFFDSRESYKRPGFEGMPGRTGRNERELSRDVTVALGWQSYEATRELYFLGPLSQTAPGPRLPNGAPLQ